MCGDAHVCGDRKTVLGVTPGNVGNSPETGLFLNWGLPVEIGWLASKAQGNSCLCLPSAGIIINVCQHILPPSLMWRLGIELSFLYLQGEWFTN